MNVLDILIAIVAVLFGLYGFYRGLIHQLFFFVAMFAGIYGGMYASEPVGELFSFVSQSGDVKRLIGFALSFVLISTIVSLFGKLLHKGSRLVMLGWADHLFGLLFGAATALLVTAFGVFLLKALLPFESKLVRGSKLAPHAELLARQMLALVPASLPKRFEEKLREVRTSRSPVPGGAAPTLGPLAPPPVAPPPPVVTEHTVRPVSRLPAGTLVDARTVAKSLRVDLRYATVDNFLKQRLYTVSRCFLRPPVARRLARVQAALRRRKLGLKLWDCYRPLSIQQKLWAAAPRPGYVGDPKVGSHHNRGAAVDVTLVDAAGNELAMPTDFDEFSPRAHHDAEVPKAAARGRGILKRAMVKEGFVPLATEWWHYDAPDAGGFTLLDAPLETLP